MKYLLIDQCYSKDIGKMQVHWFKIGQVVEHMGYNIYRGESPISKRLITQIVPSHHLKQL